MKRHIRKGLVLLLLCAALLTACGGRKALLLSGLVTELYTGDDGGLTAFVIRTDSGERIGILLTEETVAFPREMNSGTQETLRSAFQAALRPDVAVFANCSRGKKRLTTGSGEQIAAYQASHLRITGGLERGAVTMGDGTPVDLLEENAAHTYRLADGTELLRVQTPSGPEDVYTGGVEGFDSLSEAAQGPVLAYYERRGLLYDERQELEKVYALYRKSEGDFQPGWVEQSVSPSASGSRVIYFLTTVTLPAGEENGSIVHNIRLEDAFDRETGAHIDLWELFAVPRDTVIQTLLDKAGFEDPLRAEMTAASWDGRIVFSPGGLSVEFEPGTLPSRQDGTGFSVEYDADVRALLRDWALPQSQS